jgi:hypothetical protein
MPTGAAGQKARHLAATTSVHCFAGGELEEGEIQPTNMIPAYFPAARRTEAYADKALLDMFQRSTTKPTVPTFPALPFCSNTGAAAAEEVDVSRSTGEAADCKGPQLPGHPAPQEPGGMSTHSTTTSPSACRRYALARVPSEHCTAGATAGGPAPDEARAVAALRMIHGPDWVRSEVSIQRAIKALHGLDAIGWAPGC